MLVTPPPLCGRLAAPTQHEKRLVLDRETHPIGENTRVKT